MTIDQILIKTEGIKKDPSRANKSIFAFIESLNHSFNSIKLIKHLHSGDMITVKEDLKDIMSYADYSTFIEASEKILPKVEREAAKALDTTFTTAYLAHTIASETNVGFTLGIVHILCVAEQPDKVKINDYVEEYKKEQDGKTISETIRLAFNTCSEFLTATDNGEKAIAALYVLRYYILKQIQSLSSNLDAAIDDMLDKHIRDALEAYQE